MSSHTRETAHMWFRYGAVWLTLLFLLALTIGSAYIPLGAGNSVLNLAIAALKALLVLLFFMHLRSSSTMIRLTAASALLWLTFIFALTFVDYLSRT
jgi:cytochrome c oxidase subunit 4